MHSLKKHWLVGRKTFKKFLKSLVGKLEKYFFVVLEELCEAAARNRVDRLKTFDVG